MKRLPDKIKGSSLAKLKEKKIEDRKIKGKR